MPALVAPTEDDWHRDPGAAVEDGSGREKDERTGQRLFSPRRPLDVFEGDGRSGQERAEAPRAAPVPRHRSEHGASCADRTDRPKWQRLSHTGTALPALRNLALPAGTKRSNPRGKTESCAPGRKAQR